jgi:hypothetical protein
VAVLKKIRISILHQSQYFYGMNMCWRTLKNGWQFLAENWIEYVIYSVQKNWKYRQSCCFLFTCRSTVWCWSMYMSSGIPT